MNESKYDVAAFEDARWRDFSQPKEFRHTAALSLIALGTVLDIGCGDGLMLSLLAERGISAEGADISDEAVKRCEEQGLKARTYDPSHSLPYPDNSFQTVVLLDVLEHVYDPLALLHEAVRITQKDVIIGVPNFSSLPARMQVLIGRVPENNQPNKGHVYWFNRRVLDVLTLQAGLKEGAMRMNTFKPFTHLGDGVLKHASNVFALSYVARYEK